MLPIAVLEIHLLKPLKIIFKLANARIYCSWSMNLFSNEDTDYDSYSIIDLNFLKDSRINVTLIFLNPFIRLLHIW